MKSLIKFGLLPALFFLFSFAPPTEKTIVVIDAGHGGADAGAQFNGMLEKDFTLSVAQKIILLNKREDVEFVLLRNSDEFVPLQARVDRINELKPDLVISLHVNNSKNRELNGMEIYISPKNPAFEKSQLLADSFLSHFSNAPLSKRGVKEGNFHILRNSESPAMIFEMGFISNEKDRDYISMTYGQNEIANNILNFVYSMKD